MIAGTTLMVEGQLRKDTKVWVEGRPCVRADLQAGMRMSLQIAEVDQQLIVGIRAAQSRLPGPATAEIERLIRQLGSDKFGEREAASKALEAVGKPALTALRRAENSGDAEVRSRARRLIEAQLRKESTWHCSLSHDAPPDPARPCSIRELNGKLYLINEEGSQTEARIQLSRHKVEATALNWGEGLKGRIEIDKDGARIKWENGTKWTQKRS
jgi:hypothetical protein